MDRQVVALLRGPHLDTAVVGGDQHRILRYQPLAGRDADAGVGGAVALVLLADEFRPAGADDHRVTGLQAKFRLRERLLQVVGRDVVGGRQHVDALQSRDVDQHAAGHEAADVLDAKLAESAACADVGKLVAIVEAVAPHLMREGVELRADLAELGDDQFLLDVTGLGVDGEG